MIEKQPVEQKKSKPDYGNGIALGVAFGLMFGVAMGNIALGLPIGIAMGLAFSQMSGKPGKVDGDGDDGLS